MNARPTAFFVATRWFGVLGPGRKIIDELEARGYRVIAFGQQDAHWQRYHNGVTQMVRLRVRRRYTSFVSDALDVMKLAAYVLYHRPKYVHSLNLKPALLAAAACTLSPRTALFLGVTGLGNTFIKAGRMEALITSLLRAACWRARFVFLSNPDDRALFVQKGLGSPEKHRMFVGPGVDLTEFDYRNRQTERPPFPVNVVCVGRLIWQKGIREYVEAAVAIKKRYGDRVRFDLIGAIDHSHPDRVPESYIRQHVGSGVISHIGWTDRLPEAMEEYDIMVCPSYREGAPRSVLEAAAMKTPSIGSDATGVRDVIVHGETGLITPLGSAEAIVEALQVLIEDPDMRRVYGENAYRQIAVPLSLAEATREQLKMYADVAGDTWLEERPAAEVDDSGGEW